VRRRVNNTGDDGPQKLTRRLRASSTEARQLADEGCKTTLLAVRRAARPPHGRCSGRKRAPCERKDQLEYCVEPARVARFGQANTSAVSSIENANVEGGDVEDGDVGVTAPSGGASPREAGVDDSEGVVSAGGRDDAAGEDGGAEAASAVSRSSASQASPGGGGAAGAGSGSEPAAPSTSIAVDAPRAGSSVSEERAGGDGFRRTVTQPLLQERLVAVAALAAGGVQLVSVDGALRGSRAREAFQLCSTAPSHAQRRACRRRRQY
jgi:hypothetical protein